MADGDEIHVEQARSILNPKTDGELMDFAADVIAEFCKDPYNQTLAQVLHQRAAYRKALQLDLDRFNEAFGTKGRL